MNSLLVAVSALFAEGDGGGGGAPPGGGNVPFFLNPIFLFAILFLLAYLMLFRPRQREEGRRQAMLTAIKKNDRVVTNSGIYGVVTSVNREANEVTIKVDETTNTKLRMTLSAIAMVLGEEPAAGTDPK